ncbi:hypothetical protein [Acrocarpospora corrugata]|nr:hypothetical protein [Acrocarpospora corrugata]
MIAAELRATAAASAWTPWQLVQAIQDKTGAPTLLMAWRLASGQTQAEVVAGVHALAADDGQACGLNVQNLSRYENGHITPGAFYKRYFALWFRCRLERLGLADDDPVVTLVGQVPAVLSDPEDVVDRREFLGLAAAAPLALSLDHTRSLMDANLRRVLPASDLEHWAQVTAGHVESYGTLAPAALLDAVGPDLAEIAHLAERYPHQRDLHLTAARMSGLVGALYTDLQHDGPARNWLHTAARYAELSSDTAARYWIAMAQAMSAFYAPAPQRVIVIADRARTMLGAATNAPAAQLSGLAARAHARLGHKDQAKVELDAAHTIVDRLTNAALNEPFFGFPRREMTMYSSQVLSYIGDPSAWDEQARALAGYPVDDPMDRPLILLDRARYLARQGNSAEASTVAVNAITSLPSDMRVPLLLTQARNLADSMTHYAPQAASTLREALASRGKPPASGMLGQ